MVLHLSLFLQYPRPLLLFSLTYKARHALAALADTHYKVYKQVVDETTKTYLTPLNEDARIEAIAEMLGGKELKETALRHAQELRNV